jgi:hypothetical protein
MEMRTIQADSVGQRAATSRHSVQEPRCFHRGQLGAIQGDAQGLRGGQEMVSPSQDRL